jgi:fluoride exporter
MREMMLVAVGGSLGALARYGTGLAAAHLLGKGFPWGTLLVNVAGCFLMGVVMSIMADLEPRLTTSPQLKTVFDLWHKGVAIGVLGGLTTFSSFGADTLRELSAGRTGIGIANIAANVILSLAAVWLGMLLMRAID